MIILWIILWIFAGITGLALVLLLVPLGMSACGAARDLDLHGEVCAWWGFGLVRIRGGRGEALHLRVAGVRVRTLAGGGDDERGEKTTAGGGPGLRWMLRHRRTLLSVVLRLLGSLRIEGRVTGSFGTGDPADTAAVFGVLGMVTGCSDRLRLDIAPRYVDEGWDLEGRVRIGIWPARTAWAALGLLFRRDVRRALKTARA